MDQRLLSTGSGSVWITLPPSSSSHAGSGIPNGAWNARRTCVISSALVTGFGVATLTAPSTSSCATR